MPGPLKEDIIHAMKTHPVARKEQHRVVALTVNPEPGDPEKHIIISFPVLTDNQLIRLAVWVLSTFREQNKTFREQAAKSGGLEVVRGMPAKLQEPPVS